MRNSLQKYSTRLMWPMKPAVADSMLSVSPVCAGRSDWW